MRVKIGDTWHDAKDEPICVRYTSDEVIQMMHNTGPNRKFAQFPDGCGTADEMREWMSEDEDEE